MMHRNMPSERVQRRIDALLDDADAALAERDWRAAAEICQAVLVLDADNEDAGSYLAAAQKALTERGGDSPTDIAAYKDARAADKTQEDAAEAVEQRRHDTRARFANSKHIPSLADREAEGETVTPEMATRRYREITTHGAEFGDDMDTATAKVHDELGKEAIKRGADVDQIEKEADDHTGDLGGKDHVRAADEYHKEQTKNPDKYQQGIQAYRAGRSKPLLDKEGNDTGHDGETKTYYHMDGDDGMPSHATDHIQNSLTGKTSQIKRELTDEEKDGFTKKPVPNMPHSAISLNEPVWDNDEGNQGWKSHDVVKKLKANLKPHESMHTTNETKFATLSVNADGTPDNSTHLIGHASGSRVGAYRPTATHLTPSTGLHPSIAASHSAGQHVFHADQKLYKNKPGQTAIAIPTGPEFNQSPTAKIGGALKRGLSSRRE
jgi:hypothetical protein